MNLILSQSSPLQTAIREQKGGFWGKIGMTLTPSILLTRKSCLWEVYAFQQEYYVVCNGYLVWDLASFWKSLFFLDRFFFSGEFSTFVHTKNHVFGSFHNHSRVYY